MEVEVRKYYSGKNLPKETKFVYDKESKERPAWIQVEGLPNDVMFLSTRINGKIHHYRIYLSLTIPLFLPTNYTKEEMMKYYDKFAEIYDEETGLKNAVAAEFLFSKLQVPKDAKILDLGAGSGISAVPLINRGYNNITLLDFSKEMLEKAKQKKELKKCNFLLQDISKLEIKSDEKFDVIFSVFAFASNSYFGNKEMQKLWEKIVYCLKPNGIFAVMGNDSEPPQSLIQKIDNGMYEIIPGFKAQWYIGKRDSLI